MTARPAAWAEAAKRGATRAVVLAMSARMIVTVMTRAERGDPNHIALSDNLNSPEPFAAVVDYLTLAGSCGEWQLLALE